MGHGKWNKWIMDRWIDLARITPWTQRRQHQEPCHSRVFPHRAARSSTGSLPDATIGDSDANWLLWQPSIVALVAQIECDLGRLRGPARRRWFPAGATEKIGVEGPHKSASPPSRRLLLLLFSGLVLSFSFAQSSLLSAIAAAS